MRRPAARWAPWLASLAVLLLVGGVAALAGRDEPDPGPAAAGPVTVPDDWRTESYGGLEIRVPPDWGLGGAPFRAAWDGDRVMECGAGPFVVPGDPDYEFVPEDAPYVGRPVTMTDVCSTGGADATPAADSAWIDPAVEPGVVDLGGGYVRETVAVGVGKVTVTSDDPGLRAQVLASARPAGVDSHGCPASLRGAPTGTTDSLEPESLSVCLYQTHRGETTLVWSARQPREAARELLALVHETSAVFDPGRICPEPADGQWVGLGLTDEAGVRAWLVATMGECSQILWPGGGSEPVASPLTRETVGPWALPGIRAYAWGPQDQADWSGVFRGYLG